MVPRQHRWETMDRRVPQYVFTLSTLFPSFVDLYWAQSSCDARLCVGAGHVVRYVAQ